MKEKRELLKRLLQGEAAPEELARLSLPSKLERMTEDEFTAERMKEAKATTWEEMERRIKASWQKKPEVFRRLARGLHQVSTLEAFLNKEREFWEQAQGGVNG